MNNNDDDDDGYQYHGGCGCFAGHNMINMADGSKQKV